MSLTIDGDVKIPSDLFSLIKNVETLTIENVTDLAVCAILGGPKLRDLTVRSCTAIDATWWSRCCMLNVNLSQVTFVDCLYVRSIVPKLHESTSLRLASITQDPVTVMTNNHFVSATNGNTQTFTRI